MFIIIPLAELRKPDDSAPVVFTHPRAHPGDERHAVVVRSLCFVATWSRCKASWLTLGDDDCALYACDDGYLDVVVVCVTTTSNADSAASPDRARWLSTMMRLHCPDGADGIVRSCASTRQKLHALCDQVLRVPQPTMRRGTSWLSVCPPVCSLGAFFVPERDMMMMPCDDESSHDVGAPSSCFVPISIAICDVSLRHVLSAYGVPDSRQILLDFVDVHSGACGQEEVVVNVLPIARKCTEKEKEPNDEEQQLIVHCAFGRVVGVVLLQGAAPGKPLWAHAAYMKEMCCSVRQQIQRHDFDLDDDPSSPHNNNNNSNRVLLSGADKVSLDLDGDSTR
eukprot:PhM_4_TR16368/c0_g1_i1/m.21325